MHIENAEIRYQGNGHAHGFDIFDKDTGSQLLYVYDVQLGINRNLLTAEVTLGDKVLLRLRGKEDMDYPRSIRYVWWNGARFTVTKCYVMDTIQQHEAFHEGLPTGPKKERLLEIDPDLVQAGRRGNQ